MSAPATELLTVEEISAVLRVSRSTTYRLIQTGVLPAVHVGRQLRVDRDALAVYLHEDASRG
jgi:putative molybdopterin biosynthesis protein